MAKKVVLVTGASRGIGKAIAVKFAKKGYNVIINCAHREQELMQTKKEIESYQVTCTAFLGDMGDMAVCEQLFSMIRKQFGSLDVLVNNAGITNDKLMMRMDAEDFTKVINANLNGAFYMMKELSALMVKKRSGVIINMASVSGLKGNPAQVNYSASKAGVVGMTLSAAKELGRRGIRVNAIAPGFIETDMTAVLTDEQKEAAAKNITLGRLGQPEDIANTALFLASDMGSYITGQVISVDGGIIM